MPTTEPRHASNSRPARWVWAVSLPIPAVGLAVAALVLAPVAMSGDLLLAVVTAMVVLALAGLISVPAASGSEFTPAYIVVASLPLIAVQGEPVFSLRSTLAIVSGGLALLWMLRSLRGDDQRRILSIIIRRSFAFTAYLAAFAFASDTIRLPAGEGGEPNQWEAFVHFMVAALAGFLVEVVMGAIVRFDRRRGRRRYLAYLTFRDFDVFMALSASGALFGLAFDAIGWWALGVAALPYLFTHGAFRRLQEAKLTYSQTVRSLAQIPEVGGHTHPGHSGRTAELAVEIAAEMGMRPADVEEVELAALMHDIGRVTLNEPTILRMGYTESDLAKWGSEIVGETSYLSGVAQVIRRQHEPYRNPGEERDHDVPLAARVVKVASAYDEATAEMGFSPLEAMERLHRGSVYDYDPEVVAVLRRVLGRRGVFDHPVRSG